jgi:hypothetical protein
VDQKRLTGKAEVVVPEEASYSQVELGSGVRIEVLERFGGRFRFDVPKRYGAAIGELSIDFALRDGRYVMTRIEATEPEGRGLNIEDVRSFRYSEVLPAAIDAVLKKSRGPVSTLLAAQHKSEGLEQIAIWYRLAELFGAPPTAAVAQHLGISPAAAAQRVRRARHAGLLPPVRRKEK